MTIDGTIDAQNPGPGEASLRPVPLQAGGPAASRTSRRTRKRRGRARAASTRHVYPDEEAASQLSATTG
jgi:hypothetical protein